MRKWIEADVDQPIGGEMLLAGGRSYQAQAIRRDAVGRESFVEPGLYRNVVEQAILEDQSGRGVGAQNSAPGFIAGSDIRLALVKTPYVTYPFDAAGGSATRRSSGGGSMMIVHGRS